MDGKQFKNDEGDQQNVQLPDGSAGNAAATGGASGSGDGDTQSNAGTSQQNGDGGASSTEPTVSSGSDNSGSGDGRTFSQADVTRMMTREKQQGRNSVFNELGIDPNDSKTIEMVKAIMAAQKQDEEPPVAPSAELAEAQHRADVAEAKAEAMMMGAQPKFVDDIVTLATAKLQSSDGGDDFKKVVSDIKEKYPVWFGEGNDTSAGSVGSRGTGSSISSAVGSQTGSSHIPSLGKRLASAKMPRKSSKSYWNDK